MQGHSTLCHLILQEHRPYRGANKRLSLVSTLTQPAVHTPVHACNRYAESRSNRAMFANDYQALFIDTIRKEIRQVSHRVIAPKQASSELASQESPRVQCCRQQGS
jgi:hypothetical protein